ncbi:HD domain-containing protein [Geothrix sp. PMB-07]|uniref:HD domain-containing protein n=1 Tax=Geothrix sp. PMB-07 TaxID=3068640 RepID=UPI0027417F50|nr:HD domain-containing protein [Geothrix sp. PMB-07]WLT31995.1 HD domain-containing protein [Geothrix sp. PMB-07]
MSHAFPFPWFKPLLARLREHLATEPFARDAAHDLGHILRTARLAERMAEEEGADVETCVAAALLHDLVYRPKNHPESPLTAQMAAELVPQWCRETGGLEHRAEAVASTVESHSWSGGGTPATLEASVVQDADRLEALGAIGVARVFATGASFGAGLWHPLDPWAENRELDDKAWSLDHFEKKLLKLAAGMKTAAGQRRAIQRERTMLAYLEALRAELGHDLPAPPVRS